MAFLDTNIAWAAGILDGEGCVLLNRGGNYKRPVSFTPLVFVVNTDPKMLLKLQKLFGGRIYNVKQRSAPKTWKPRWIWKVSSETALKSLDLMLPYLVTKREQAQLLLGFREIKRIRGGNMKTKPFTAENSRLFDEQVWLKAELEAVRRESADIGASP